MGSSRWIVTGGAGYIGAHVVRALLSSGREAFVIDDMSTGVASRLPAEVSHLLGSVTDSGFLASSMQRIKPAGVIHLAGKKSPTDSVADPLLYARENVGGVISLLEAMRQTGVSRVVFSSSCSVYGTQMTDHVAEDAPTTPESPYGESKLYGERLLNSAATAYGLGVISLRYFNVVGAAEPGLADTGPRNLVPQVFAALRQGTAPRIFGDDYPTADGTCVRDYVDVEDVADAHVQAVAALEQHRRVAAYNVGGGTGSSVLQVLDAIRRVSGQSFEAQILPRRPGDPARIVGQVDLIANELGWRATRGLTDMVRSAWQAVDHREALQLN